MLIRPVRWRWGHYFTSFGKAAEDFIEGGDHDVAASGLSVSVGTPYIYGEPISLRTEEDCKSWQESYSNDNTYTFVCEQHDKFPKITGKVDRDLYHSMKDTSYGFGKACGVHKWNQQHPHNQIYKDRVMYDYQVRIEHGHVNIKKVR